MSPKIYLPDFFIYWVVAILLREIPSVSPFFPFFEGIPRNEVTTAQNIKNREGNFLETLMRMIHAKIQTSMTMLRRVETVCVISQKNGFFPSYYKREFEGFRGKNEWQWPNFWPLQIFAHIFWKCSQKCCFGVNFRCFGPFLADLEHILGQKVAFSPPIL